MHVDQTRRRALMIIAFAHHESAARPFPCWAGGAWCRAAAPEPRSLALLFFAALCCAVAPYRSQVATACRITVHHPINAASLHKPAASQQLQRRCPAFLFAAQPLRRTCRSWVRRSSRARCRSLASLHMRAPMRRRPGAAIACGATTMRRARALPNVVNGSCCLCLWCGP